ncbi:MAG: glycosyltransferase [Deltaproteobacteria bacterium]|nr:glycosyltransferase [Deltaproteobacteria bacterium]
MKNGKPHGALFRNNFLPYSETFIHDELRHHNRYDMTVFARQWRNRSQFQGHRVIAVEEIPSRRALMASLIYGATARNRTFDNIFKTEKIDIIHAHFGHNALYGGYYAKKYNIPMVVSLHGRDVTILLGKDKYRPGYLKYLFGYKQLFKSADLFLAASTELKELIQSVGCPEEKVLVHRLGIDVTNFSPAKQVTSVSQPVIVMVGRFTEKKGHKYGIEAVKKACDAGFDPMLIIAGDGPLLPEYKKLIISLNLENNVEFTGSLPHSEILKLIQQAQIVMAPSVVAKNLDRESGIIVAKEASACSVPVIGTIHGGIPDIIDDGKTGFLVRERDSEALGERLITLLEDRDLRDKFGKAARNKMLDEYDIRQKVEELEQIYDDVICGKYKKINL